jgi:MFS family permease
MADTARRPPFLLLVGSGTLCTIVLVVFARLAYGLVLPAMRDSLGLSNTDMATLGTITALGYLSLVMVAGVFAARFGARRSVLLGLLIACVGFAGLSQASDYRMLVPWMVLLGFGTAFGYTPLISLLASWYPNRRGTVIGLANAGVGVGTLVSGHLVPWLISTDAQDGWRLVWEVFAGCGALVMLAVFAFLHDPPRQNAPDAGTPGHQVLRIYRHPRVVMVGLVYGVVGMTYIAQAVFMYSFALDAGITELRAGQMVSTLGLVSVFSGPTWGSLADRIGHGNTLTLCMALALLATVLPVMAPEPWAFALHYPMLGLCIGGLFTSTLAAASSSVPAWQSAVAVSFVTLFFAAGQLVGPYAAGLLIEWHSFRAAFAASCLMMGLGLVFCWRLRRT